MRQSIQRSSRADSLWHLYSYPLVMTNSSPWYRWPIEIDGLPIDSMVIFNGYLLNNQMVILFIGCKVCQKCWRNWELASEME